MNETRWTIAGSNIVDERGKFVCNHAKEYGPLIAAAPALADAVSGLVLENTGLVVGDEYVTLTVTRAAWDAAHDAHRTARGETP